MESDESEFIHPEEKSCNNILVSWLNPLIQLANERTIREEDIWPCPRDETVDVQSKKFWEAWYRELDEAEQANRKASLLRALLNAYWDRFFLAGGYQLIFMLLQLAQPFLVGNLVLFIQDPSQPLSRGIGLALGFAAFSFACSLSFSQAICHLRRLGVAVRSAVMMAVYEQALKLTTSARMQNTVGMYFCYYF
jgi:ATP-binding cassette, subfamily C (CFTR/MRP), member 1